MFAVNSLVITFVVLSVLGAIIYYYFQIKSTNDLVVEVEKNTDEISELVAEVEKEENRNEPKSKESNENEKEPLAVKEGDDLPLEDQEEEPACIQKEKINANIEMNIVRRIPEARNPSLYNLGNLEGAPEDIFVENNWEV